MDELEFKALQKENRSLKRHLALAETNIKRLQAFSDAQSKIEAALSESYKKEAESFQLTLNNVTSIIFLLTLEGIFTYASKTFLALLGVTGNEFIRGRHYRDVLVPLLTEETFEEYNAYAEAAEADQTSRSFEMSFDIGAERRTFAVHITPMIDDAGKTVGTMTLINDITEINHARNKAEKANLTKSRFLARISHEIRTPITAILGFSQIQLKRSALPAEIYEAFLAIYKSANFLSGIIDDLIDLSMIESDKLKLTVEKYETAGLIGDAVSMCHLFLGAKDVKFIINADENLPMYFVGDFVRIGQILNNLLSNAFKYTEEGEIEFSLRSERKDGYTAFIITVRDTGLGMTPEQVQNIYQDYLRFHESSRSAPGLGLGMAIVRNFAGLMGAGVVIESEVGKGTTVTVTIPQQTAGPETIGRETAVRLRQLEASPDIAKTHFDFEPECMHYGKVLVVDDIDANLYVSKGLMEFYDLKVETAGSGPEAIEKIKGGNVYDIIFIDHMMPVMDGAEALGHIREAGYSHPVVALTANAVIGEAEKFIACGFDGYLSKPIQTDMLDGILTRFIRDKQPPEVLVAAKKYREDNPGNNGKYIGNFQTDSGLMEKLKADFAGEQKNTVAEIRAAIDAQDFKKARLLAHSLRSRADLIFEQYLAELIKPAELLLSQGKAPSDEALSAIESCVSRVIERVKQPSKNTAAEKSPSHAINALKQLDILEPMLAGRKTSSRNYLDGLRSIPEAAIFVKQVEKYDFGAAVKSLGILRLLLEEGV